MNVQSQVTKADSRFQLGRAAYMPKPVLWTYVSLVIIGIAIYLYYTLGPIRIAGRSLLLEQYPYYYLLFAIFGACVFLIAPARSADRARIPIYDYVASALMLVINIYFSLHADEIINVGWTPAPELRDVILAGVFSLIALESGRRTGGLSFFIICIVAIIYPLMASLLPGGAKGISYSLDYVVSVMAFGRQGAPGMPAAVLGDVIVGFLIFCGMLLVTGAGNFFLELAMAGFGRFRGGAAKVAVVASALFGTVTGNPLANAMTVGSVTIPAMKKGGYTAESSGAILACASLGTSIMPPVMGTIAFIMAVLIGVTYAEICIAAIIPALLYYFGLLMQVDGYAGKHGLKGMSKSELPSAIETLKTGWPFILVIAFLVFGLLFMRWSGGTAAVYSAGLCLALSFIYKKTRLTRANLVPMIATIGNMIVGTVSVILPAAFIIAGLQMTGTLGALIAQIITASGDPFIILLVAALVTFVFGMPGLSFIAYLILAATMAPALAQASGMNIIGLHLFIAYYALIDAITPPVAIVSFVTAALAGAPPMKTSWVSMRYGIVLYFIPFFFVYDPALLMHGLWYESLYRLLICLVGIGLLSGGIEGYLWWVGKLKPWARAVLIVGGFCIAMPVFTYVSIGGALLSGLTVVLLLVSKRRKQLPAPT
jgi:TRAP transporter 4TM/12TM fusion protein